MLNKNWKNLLKYRTPEEVNKAEMVRIVVELLKYLYDNLETPRPSFDVLVCEEMLTRTMKTFYSDHHPLDVLSFAFGLTRFVAILSCRYMCL
jgi:hypothetical protein